MMKTNHHEDRKITHEDASIGQIVVQSRYADVGHLLQSGVVGDTIGALVWSST